MFGSGADCQASLFNRVVVSRKGLNSDGDRTRELLSGPSGSHLGCVCTEPCARRHHANPFFLQKAEDTPAKRQTLGLILQ